MVGFEILVKIDPEKRVEFLQAFEMLKDIDQQDDNRIDHNLFEEVQEQNTFIWIEHWETTESLSRYFSTNTFISMLGAIEVLGNTIQQRSFTIMKEDEYG